MDVQARGGLGWAAVAGKIRFEGPEQFPVRARVLHRELPHRLAVEPVELGMLADAEKKAVQTQVRVQRRPTRAENVLPQTQSFFRLAVRLPESIEPGQPPADSG